VTTPRPPCRRPALLPDRLCCELSPCLEARNALHIRIMAEPAQRMRLMRERRRRRGLRELRLVVPDPRLQSVRRRVAAQVARLDRASEEDALRWIEAVSEFDNETR